MILTKKKGEFKKDSSFLLNYIYLFFCWMKQVYNSLKHEAERKELGCVYVCIICFLQINPNDEQRRVNEEMDYFTYVISVDSSEGLFVCRLFTHKFNAFLKTL